MTETETKSLRLLCDGFGEEFIHYLEHNDEFQDALMQAAILFVSDNIPLVSEDYELELSAMMTASVHTAFKR